MIVDDVKDDGDPNGMSTVDEMAEIGRPTVEPGRREEIDAVISPAEPALEFRQRHNFETRDAELSERRQLTRRRLPAPLRGESADMHLVDDEMLTRDPAPGAVGPSKS